MVDDEGRGGDQEDSELDALLDLLTLGIEAVVPAHEDGLGGFIHRLSSVGILKGAPPHSLAERSSVNVDVLFRRDEPGHTGYMSLEGRLSLSIDKQSIVVRPASEVRGNALRALRSQLGEAAGPFGLDGNDNVIGAREGERAELLRRQLQIIERSVDGFVGALREAVAVEGAPLTVTLRLRGCEVCRDVAKENASAFVAALSHSSPADADAQRNRFYLSRPHADVLGHHVTLSWDDGRHAGRVVSKLYAKRPDLVRMEVKALDRGAIAHLLGLERVASNVPRSKSGKDVSDLLKRVVGGAEVELHKIQSFYQAGKAPQYAPLEFLGALAPLLRVLNPPTRERGGRPTSSETSETAYEALRALLQTGRYSAKGIRANHLVRIALDEMVGDPNGAVERGGSRGTLYTVRSMYTKTRVALAHSLVSAEMVIQKQIGDDVFLGE
ncbi:MAG: hypothetical protein ACLGJC_16390 [Alphaproteobacteria bacterium]